MAVWKHSQSYMLLPCCFHSQFQGCFSSKSQFPISLLYLPCYGCPSNGSGTHAMMTSALSIL